jgi:dienelactone hydrolase
MLATAAALVVAVGSGVRQELVLPAPTGPFRIGVIGRTWEDARRADSLDSPTGLRRVHALIWYPARESDAAPAEYVEGLSPAAGELAATYARVRPHARKAAPLAERIGRAPILILAPGRIAAASDYTALAEDLASHGYVVVGVNSPGHSKIFRPDGTLEPVRFGPMPPSSYPDGFDALQEPMNALVGEDLRFALAQVDSLDRSDPMLGGHLALDSIGMMGHSNGAMAGSRACAAEPRCKAFLGIEGSQTREIRLGGNDKPFGLVYGEETLSFDTQGVFTRMREHARAPFTLYRVADAGHNSFTDLFLVRPTLFNYEMTAARGIEVTRAIVRSFFERHLRGNASGDALIAGLTEVEAERVR